MLQSTAATHGCRISSMLFVFVVLFVIVFLFLAVPLRFFMLLTFDAPHQHPGHRSVWPVCLSPHALRTCGYDAIALLCNLYRRRCCTLRNLQFVVIGKRDVLFVSARRVFMHFVTGLPALLPAQRAPTASRDAQPVLRVGIEVGANMAEKQSRQQHVHVHLEGWDGCRWQVHRL